VSTATAVPVTRGELEGDEALETLLAVGRVRLLRDAFDRFRAADGFSHSRALAFQFTLALLPALIAVVGLGAALEQETFRLVVQQTLDGLAPGAAGDLLTAALRQGSTSAASETGEAALAGGGIAALLAGTQGMAQLERGANRIYGVERDRPLVRKYGLGLILTCSAGLLVLLAFVLLVAGAAVRDAAGWGPGFDTVWTIGRWPLGVMLVVAAVALLFERAPRRQQPEASWLAFGAAVSVLCWLVSTGLLALFAGRAANFGATYGPLAGTIGVLLWAFLTSVALLFGLAFAAQLEAARAGVTRTRVDRDENLDDGESSSARPLGGPGAMPSSAGT
jgi:YihY family inner membrane protein